MAQVPLNKLLQRLADFEMKFVQQEGRSQVALSEKQQAKYLALKQQVTDAIDTLEGGSEVSAKMTSCYSVLCGK